MATICMGLLVIGNSLDLVGEGGSGVLQRCVPYIQQFGELKRHMKSQLTIFCPPGPEPFK